MNKDYLGCLFWSIIILSLYFFKYVFFLLSGLLTGLLILFVLDFIHTFYQLKFNFKIQHIFNFNVEDTIKAREKTFNELKYHKKSSDLPKPYKEFEFEEIYIRIKQRNNNRFHIEVINIFKA